LPIVNKTVERQMEQIDPILKQIYTLVTEAAGGNTARAARVLGINRTTLVERLKRYGIDIDDIRMRASTNALETLAQCQADKASLEDIDNLISGTPTVFHEKQPFLYNKMLWIMQCLKEEHWHRTRAAQRAGVCLRTIRVYINHARALGYEIPKGLR
jgi:transcriptional regulator with GAF, ATPase, and Fis domain